MCQHPRDRRRSRLVEPTAAGRQHHMWSTCSHVSSMVSEDLEEAETYIEELERKIRDLAVLSDEIPPELLAQGDDLLSITVTFQSKDKLVVRRDVKLSWNEVFRVIGPSMYGYIVRKRSGTYEPKTYPFQDNLEEHIRSKLIDEVQNRKIKLEESQLDRCVIQFKELGLLQFQQNKNEDDDVFRSVTLTELGERRLTLLSIDRREPNFAPDHNAIRLQPN